MPSRKREKGKARKAKAAERHWKEVERYHWKGWTTVSSCNHNAICPADDHPVYKFIDELFVQTGSGGAKKLHTNKDFEDSCRGLWTLKTWVKKSFTNHSYVWNDTDHRKMARNILLSIGTNIILKGGSVCAAQELANAVSLLEKFVCVDDDSEIIATSTDKDCSVNLTVCSAAPTIRDLVGGKDRTVIRFFHKRISCDCLKVKYAQSKRLSQKVGVCNSCAKSFDLESLKVCGVCRIGQYCCVECQSQAWKDHKNECKFFNLGQDALQWLTTQDPADGNRLYIKCNQVIGSKNVTQ